MTFRFSSYNNYEQGFKVSEVGSDKYRWVRGSSAEHNHITSICQNFEFKMKQSHDSL